MSSSIMGNVARLAFIIFFFNIAMLTGKAQTVRAVHHISGQGSNMTVYEYNAVDVAPSFPGGTISLMRYINAMRRYPASAYEQNIEGRVTCGFVVSADGSIREISVMKSAHPSLDAEAVRLIEKMPKWEPGTVEGRKVAVYCVLPIAFRL
ncbi:MAG: energy transducer TonB [Muribaculaceae bacterium]|jgi:TonB family C-terminal domain|nr:energy transducer TonB [Muribaculaceae bacterium]